MDRVADTTGNPGTGYGPRHDGGTTATRSGPQQCWITENRLKRMFVCAEIAVAEREDTDSAAGHGRT